MRTCPIHPTQRSQKERLALLFLEMKGLSKVANFIEKHVIKISALITDHKAVCVRHLDLTMFNQYNRIWTLFLFEFIWLKSAESGKAFTLFIFYRYHRIVLFTVAQRWQEDRPWPQVVKFQMGRLLFTEAILLCDCFFLLEIANSERAYRVQTDDWIHRDWSQPFDISSRSIELPSQEHLRDEWRIRFWLFLILLKCKSTHFRLFKKWNVCCLHSH